MSQAASIHAATKYWTGPASASDLAADVCVVGGGQVAQDAAPRPCHPLCPAACCCTHVLFRNGMRNSRPRLLICQNAKRVCCGTLLCVQHGHRCCFRDETALTAHQTQLHVNAKLPLRGKSRVLRPCNDVRRQWLCSTGET